MESNMSANITNQSVNFDYIFEDRPLKFVGIIFSSVMIVVIFCLASGIIWYENCGSDLKRILTNRLVSSICWCVLESLFVIWSPDLLLYFYRPFPNWVCILQAIFRNAVLLRLTILFDAIIIARYVFIFWLKNPLNFDDEIWCTFINFWTIIFRSVFWCIKLFF